MLAFVFPGQGSQSVGMQAALAAESAAVRSTYQQASQVLGYDLWAVVGHGPPDRLNATECTQPAMLTAGVAAYRAWLERDGPEPALLAGHSLGEFSALVCGGAMAFEDAVALTRYRGEVMQAAVPAGQGAMAAVLGLDDALVEAACSESAQGQVVEPVNYNAPGQIVIAGEKAAVERAIAACTERGAKRAVLLPVSVPAHSTLMRAAGERLRERLATVRVMPPKLAVYAIGLARHEEPERIKDAVVRQLSAPVRWADTVRDMVAKGARVIVECGPGKVLTALNRRIERNKEIAMAALEDPPALAAALTAARAASP
jgi:[acyl-carrier-protein] S-malonyltransferase